MKFLLVRVIQPVFQIGLELFHLYVISQIEPRWRADLLAGVTAAPGRMQTYYKCQDNEQNVK